VLVNVLERFAAEGVWGVTPHIIPHHALHSQSGTLSQVLGIHGPNLGVGGGTDAAVQGFLTALTWLTSGTVPGVWLVISGWSPEYVPDESGAPEGDPECLALALGLVPLEAGQVQQSRIRVRPSSRGRSKVVDLEDLAEGLGGDGTNARESRLQRGSLTLRFDPGHVVGGRPGPTVIARGCGVQVELEPAAWLSTRRRSG
jgi:hypothetical protein